LAAGRGSRTTVAPAKTGENVKRAFWLCALTMMVIGGHNSAHAAQRITFATDWKAQAEQGGFYQALGEGLYAARGLDVEIRQGGPAVNIPQLLAAGAVDMGMGSNSFIPLNLVAAGAKVKAVMSAFQKDPQVLITHPRDDIRSIADMRGHPIMISDASITAFWVWLRAKYGFADRDIRKYTFNLAPFLVDKNAIQQGYLTSEPYLIEQKTGEQPRLYLLADTGYPSYAAMVLVPDALIAGKPETVQAFVDATIEGWDHFVYGDRSAGTALILKDNPDMSEALIAQAVEKMKQYGIVRSGDALTEGIGTMTDARWKEFFGVMAKEGVYSPDLTYGDAYTLAFLHHSQAH